MKKREKSAAVGLVVCFVAMIAVVGMITFSNFQQRTQKQELTKNEIVEKTEIEEPEPAQVTNTDVIQAEIETPVVEDVTEVVITPAPSFAPNDALIWPIDGNVLLNYSMDQTVYFSTLDQYKYNPAIIIGGEVGDEVQAAADGKVTEVKTDAQTGTTITVNLGNDFEVVYGQLKDITVKEGDYVTKGDKIGVLSEPTKYYSVEGPNLYFQVLQNGKPVNPMEFMTA